MLKTAKKHRPAWKFFVTKWCSTVFRISDDNTLFQGLTFVIVRFEKVFSLPRLAASVTTASGSDSMTAASSSLATISRKWPNIKKGDEAWAWCDSRWIKSLTYIWLRRRTSPESKWLSSGTAICALGSNSTNISAAADNLSNFPPSRFCEGLFFEAAFWGLRPSPSKGLLFLSHSLRKHLFFVCYFLYGRKFGATYM